MPRGVAAVGATCAKHTSASPVAACFGGLSTVDIREMTEEDLPEVQKVDHDAWSELLSRETGREVRTPARPIPLLASYISSDPSGCFVAVDGTTMVGCVFCRTFGRIGWLGPLTVLPGHQGKGTGKALIAQSLQYMAGAGCTVTGLETPANNSLNIGLYSKQGFKPLSLSLRMDKRITPGQGPLHDLAVHQFCEYANPDDLLAVIRELSDAIEDGLDYSKEVAVVEKHALGTTLIIQQADEIVGFAIIHTFPVPESSVKTARLKVAVLSPSFSGPQYFRSLISACEDFGNLGGNTNLVVPVYAPYRRAYQELFASGFKVRGSLARMAREPYGPQNPDQYHLSTWSG